MGRRTHEKSAVVSPPPSAIMVTVTSTVSTLPWPPIHSLGNTVCGAQAAQSSPDGPISLRALASHDWDCFKMLGWGGLPL